MKTNNALKFIATCALFTGATAVFAAGIHAGGHAEDSVGKAGVGRQSGTQFRIPVRARLPDISHRAADLIIGKAAAQQGAKIMTLAGKQA